MERVMIARSVLKLGVLISGKGTNLQAIFDAIARGSLHATVSLVVSNVADAGGLKRAQERGVPTRVFAHCEYGSREAFDRAVRDALLEHEVACVVLAGFMRIVTPVLLSAFPWRVVNIHPALLPAFPGVKAPGQALNYGVRVTGCTAHFVDSGTDTGPIIAQAVVPVLEGDDEATLSARIRTEEHILLPKVLEWIARGRVLVDEGGAADSGRPHVRVRREKLIHEA